LFNPGEEDAVNYTGYSRNITITGRFAQEVSGAAIVLERKSEQVDFRADDDN
jgi:hypothetical protein